MDNVFTCSRCGGTFTRGWSEAEARAESLRLWDRPYDAPDMVIVCDDCHRAFMAWMRRHYPEALHG